VSKVRTEKLLSGEDYGKIGTFGRFRIAVCEAFENFEAARRIAEKALGLQAKFLENRLVQQINSLVGLGSECNFERTFYADDDDDLTWRSGRLQVSSPEEDVSSADSQPLKEGMFVINPPGCRPGLYKCERNEFKYKVRFEGDYSDIGDIGDINQGLKLVRCNVKVGGYVCNCPYFDEKGKLRDEKGVFQMSSNGTLKKATQARVVLENPPGVPKGHYLVNDGDLIKLKEGDVFHGWGENSADRTKVYRIRNDKLELMYDPTPLCYETPLPGSRDYVVRTYAPALHQKISFAGRFFHCTKEGKLESSESVMCCVDSRAGPEAFKCIPLKAGDAVLWWGWQGQQQLCKVNDKNQLVSLREGEVAEVNVFHHNGSVSTVTYRVGAQGKPVQMNLGELAQNPIGKERGIYRVNSHGLLQKLEKGQFVSGFIGGKDAGGKPLELNKFYKVVENGGLKEVLHNEFFKNPIDGPSGVYRMDSNGNAIRLEEGACVTLTGGDFLGKANNVRNAVTCQVSTDANRRSHLELINANEIIFTPSYLRVENGSLVDDIFKSNGSEGLCQLGADGKLSDNKIKEIGRWDASRGKVQEGEIFSLGGVKYQRCGNRAIPLEKGKCVFGASGGNDAGGKPLDSNKFYKVVENGGLKEVLPGEFFENPIGKQGIWLMTQQRIMTQLQEGECVIKYDKSGKAERIVRAQKDAKGIWNLVKLNKGETTFARKLHIVGGPPAVSAGPKTVVRVDGKPAEPTAATTTINNAVLQVTSDGAPAYRELRLNECVIEKRIDSKRKEIHAQVGLVRRGSSYSVDVKELEQSGQADLGLWRYEGQPGRKGAWSKVDIDQATNLGQ
jgi:hypothetical protein